MLATGEKYSKIITKNKNSTSNTEIVVFITASIIISIVFYELATKCAKCAKFDNPKCNDGWENVAKYYELAAKQVSKESPEYFERLADSYRCLMYKDLEIYEIQKKSENKNKELDFVSNYKKAREYYEKASDLYSNKANKCNDKANYDFQINSVKPVELSAKAEECRCEIGDIVHNLDYSEQYECMGYLEEYKRQLIAVHFIMLRRNGKKLKV